MVALAAVLCAGSKPAPAQQTPRNDSGARSTDDSRCPYYYQLADILYPSQCTSEPCVWVNLFDAMATQRHGCARGLPAEASTCDDLRVHYNREAPERGNTLDLMRESRRMYREGDLEGAAMLADLACRLRPDHAGAQHARLLVYLARQVRAANPGEAEESSVNACAAAAASATGVCRAVGARAGCEAPARCACGEKCCCANPPACACGAKCGCKPTQPPKTEIVPGTRVNRSTTVIRQAVVVGQQPDMVIMPPEVLRKQALDVPASRPCCERACPIGSGAPAPKPACWVFSTPGLAKVEAVLARPAQTVRPARFDAVAPASRTVIGVRKESNGAIYLSSPSMDARADNMSTNPDDECDVLLVGNVELNLRMDNHPARILTQRARINLKDQTYEVMPANFQGSDGPRVNVPALPALKPMSECVPCTPAARGWR
jgi:hypothetical protein